MGDSLLIVAPNKMGMDATAPVLHPKDSCWPQQIPFRDEPRRSRAGKPVPALPLPKMWIRLVAGVDFVYTDVWVSYAASLRKSGGDR